MRVIDVINKLKKGERHYSSFGAFSKLFLMAIGMSSTTESIYRYSEGDREFLTMKRIETC